ncbi:MAG: nuclease [Methanobrevibacter sp.]|nr:nuclease [Methanobrevibacter sp.]
MFEEEQDNKIYNLIITRGIDQENEYGQFTEKLYSKPDFLWTESMARDYAPFGESFFKKVDVIVVLSGIYNYNQVAIDILIQKAEEFDIPILLVRPYGMEIVPEELEAKAKSVVGWNANCIVDDIRSIVNGDYDELCDDF